MSDGKIGESMGLSGNLIVVPQPMLLSLGKAARQLGCTRYLLMRGIERRQINAVQLGTRMFIPHDEVKRLGAGVSKS